MLLTYIYFSIKTTSLNSPQVNEYQAKIKDTTRKMMAIVSELSMNQAQAMKLQQEVRGHEQDLEQAYVRMERGEAPSEEAEREWLRMVRDEIRRSQETNERKEVSRVFVASELEVVIVVVVMVVVVGWVVIVVVVVMVVVVVLLLLLMTMVVMYCASITH